MHLLFVLSDVVPASTCARDVVAVPGSSSDVEAVAGPSSKSVRLSQGEQALNVSWSVTYVVLNDNLRIISNCRHTLVIPTDAVALREACSRHGMRPELLDDDAHCFIWLVDHLFMGGCIQVQDTSMYWTACRLA